LAQKVELIALTCTLQLATKRTVNIYTDSKYAFTTLHVHGATYIKKGDDYFRRKRQIPSCDYVYLFWVGRGFTHSKRKGPKSGPCLIKENDSHMWDLHLHWIRQWTRFCGELCKTTDKGTKNNKIFTQHTSIRVQVRLKR
jgi:hypothetical protein